MKLKYFYLEKYRKNGRRTRITIINYDNFTINYNKTRLLRSNIHEQLIWFKALTQFRARYQLRVLDYYITILLYHYRAIATRTWCSDRCGEGHNYCVISFSFLSFDLIACAPASATLSAWDRTGQCPAALSMAHLPPIKFKMCQKSGIIKNIYNPLLLYF